VPKQDKINLCVSSSGKAGYLYLPTSTVERIVTRNVKLHELLEDFKGPEVIFDFDKDNILIGIEVLID
jgi:hypothetical protein